MITRIILKGFQSHVNSDIQLAAGLNVVTGPTDSGKTALIRAVRWVAFNDPQGEAFVNAGVGEAEVVIFKADGTVITKRRRSGKTSYCLQRPGLPEMNFNKAELPEEIRQALGIEKQGFGDYETALNFAFQLDAPFLISEPPSAGAKVLGKLAGTEVVDLAIKSVAKENYKYQQERLAAGKEIERLEAELQGYDDLEQLKKALAAVEYLLIQVDRANDRAVALTGLRDQYIAATEAITKYADILDRLAIVPDLEADLQRIEKAQQRYDTLLGLYDQLGHLEASLAGLLEEEKRYAGLEAVAAILATVENNYQRLASLLNLATLYANYSQEASRLDKILTATQELDTAATLLEGLEGKRQRISQLILCSTDYQRLTEAIAGYDRVIVVTDNVGQAAQLLAAVEEKRQRLTQLVELKALYDIKQRTYDQAVADEKKAAADLKTCQEELNALWASLKVCPMCDRPIEGACC